MIRADKREERRVWMEDIFFEKKKRALILNDFFS